MLLALAAATLLAAPAAGAEVVRVRVDGPADLRRLRGMDTTEVIREGTLDVVVRGPADERRIAGMERVARPPARVAQAPGTLPSGRTAYRDLAAYASDIRRMVTEHPGRVRRVEIGASVEGRPIEGVEIAEDVVREDGRPLNVVLGLQHGREWSSGEMAMEHAFALAASRDDLLARVRTVVLPVINPDGFVASRGGVDPLRRKNARGVDLNRNHGAYWGGPGSSDNPLSETYRGPAPFSEPEAAALRAWSSGRHAMVVNAVHSYGGAILHQPGFTRTDEPDLPSGAAIPYVRPMAELARAMAAEAGYTSGPAHNLYDVTGAAEDWNYFVQGAFAFTTEIGHEGFQPPFEVVRAHFPRLNRAFLLAAEAAADRANHAVLTGLAPPGRTLRLVKETETTTSYVLTGTDGPFPQRGAASRLPERLETALTVPAGGRFTWHVNPSTRPTALLAGDTEAYTLSCEGESRRVTVGLGQRAVRDLACGGAVVRITSVRRRGRRLVVRLRITGEVGPLRARLGRHRARAGRRFTIRAPRRAATLRITGRAASGEPVRAARRVTLG